MFAPPGTLYAIKCHYLYMHYKETLEVQAPEPSGLLDFVLHALRALRPCDPRLHPSQANTITRANTSFFSSFFNFFSLFSFFFHIFFIFFIFFHFFFISASKYYFDDDDDDLVVESNAAVRIQPLLTAIPTTSLKMSREMKRDTFCVTDGRIGYSSSWIVTKKLLQSLPNLSERFDKYMCTLRNSRFT